MGKHVALEERDSWVALIKTYTYAHMKFSNSRSDYRILQKAKHLSCQFRHITRCQKRKTKLWSSE